MDNDPRDSSYFCSGIIHSGRELFSIHGQPLFQGCEIYLRRGNHALDVASSVVYPMKVSNPKLQTILNLNPMTPILDAYRDVLLRGKLPDFNTLGYATIVSVALFLIGWVVFYKMQYKFAEKV